MKVPEPVPVCAFVSLIVGVVFVVLYTIPRSVIVAPPSDEMVPPVEMKVVEIFDTEVVVIVGGSAVTPVTFPYTETLSSPTNFH